MVGLRKNALPSGPVCRAVPLCVPPWSWNWTTRPWSVMYAVAWWSKDSAGPATIVSESANANPAHAIAPRAASATATQNRLPGVPRLSICPNNEILAKTDWSCSGGRGDAIGVEDRVDVPQARDALLELLRVSDLQ